MSKLWRVIRAKPDSLAVYLDLRAESVTILHDPKKRNGAAALCLPLVLKIDSVRNVPKVGPSIVRRVSVPVIDVKFGPCAGNEKPDDSMGLVVPSIDVNLYPAIVANVPSNRACKPAACASSAHKDASLRIVVKKLAKALRCKFGRMCSIQSIPSSCRPGRGMTSPFRSVELGRQSPF